MIYSLLPDNYAFPDPEEAEHNGLIAIGGDLSPQRLIEAYASGIFPWYDEGSPILWWSLDPRMVMPPSQFKCSKSLQRTLHSGRFEVRIDTLFEKVIEGCASIRRKDQIGTWITDEMKEAYTTLHNMGLAHSFETFLDGELVGGLYGVSLGSMFFGESMFHTVTDASKVAFARLVEFCLLHHFSLIDAQQETEHLASLGARPIKRSLFLQQLHQNPLEQTLKELWTGNTVVLLLGSNQGNRQHLLHQALQLINDEVGWVSQLSPFYQSEPWGFESNDPFLNVACTVETDYSPHEVLSMVLDIEQRLGRKRPTSGNLPVPNEPRTYSSRPIDIDLMFYNSLHINTPVLQLPHPRLHLRRFALQPLCDICPEFKHPTMHLTIEQLLQQCGDNGKVEIVQ